MALSDAMHSNLTHADEPQSSRKNSLTPSHRRSISSLLQGPIVAGSQLKAVVVGSVEKWRRDESVGRERSESQSFVLDLLKGRRVAARIFTCRPDPEGMTEVEGGLNEEEEAKEVEAVEAVEEGEPKEEPRLELGIDQRSTTPEPEDPNSNPETSDDPELRACKDSGKDLETEEDGIILEDGEDLANEPEEKEESEEEAIDDTKLPKYRLLGNACLSIPGGSEQNIGGRSIEGLKDLNLKKLVAEELTPLQKSLGQLVFNYVDVLYGERTLGNAEELRRMYSLHAPNHVLKLRARKLSSEIKASEGSKSFSYYQLERLAWKEINALVDISYHNQRNNSSSLEYLSHCQIFTENKKRFQDTYYTPPDAEQISPNKPEDFRALFSGNYDDLSSEFYNSDMILASPLGLSMTIGDESDKKRDYDFLSSIELVVVDQADALLMQNSNRLEHIFKHLNLIPKDPHGFDFGRTHVGARRVRDTGDEVV
ncbi:unnamed protein product [Tuber aestivum]|uniref:UTP25 NTP hydrolase-like domain-containing protein n=1 Tax=Tuber aestivum TaxID=59557 RepID=A0A292PSM9_9PEZI|nr:unnamed protein product [Tuber aestivum]